MTRPDHLLLAALVFAAVPAGAAPLPTAASRNVTVTLVPETDAVAPGQRLAVGLHLKMAEGWHTYWSNPGDSGLPTRIRWTLPDGFTAGPIEWPRPERMPAGPLMSYGYGGEVLLLSELAAPAALGSREVTLSARVSWLECKEACLPGKADLAITLPVAASGATRPEWAAAFARARGEIPRPDARVKAEALAAGDALVLTVAGAGAPRHAYFFPAAPQVVDHAAPQEVTPAGRAFRLRLRRADNAAVPERLQGVLEADGRAWSIDARVVRGTAALEPPAAVAPVDGGATGLPLALAFAFAGGLILNLMPCVLPVLSLKVMGFVRRGGEAGGALRHGLAFAAGVLVFFWLLGGALIALRAAGEQIGWGFQLQSPPFVVFLAALFLLVALNLFGVFEVGRSLSAAGNLAAGREGLASSFWSGALATVVATPCTAPFMGSALGYALGQPAWVGMMVFGALALGMAAPYVVLSASPRLLKALPKPGPWMDAFKQAMGFPMLATVLFLVWLFGRQVGVNGMTGLLAALVLVAAGAWLYGRGSEARHPHPRRAMLIVATGLVAAGLVVGLSQAQAAPAASTGTHDAGWERYDEARLRALRAAGTPVFLDFTADWCLTCQVNHRVALSDPEVRARFEREGVVLMKADWTLRDEAITRALLAHGRQGVPLYVLHGRGPDAPARLLPEVLTPGVVLQALDETF